MGAFKNLLIDTLGRRKDNFDWRSTQPPLDLDVVENVCVLHHNVKNGDAILMSMLVDALAKARPDLPIYVAAPSAFAAYWSSHPAVSRVIPLDIRFGPHLFRAFKAWFVARSWRRKIGIDVVVSFHPFARLEQFALLRSLKARATVGFNKDIYRLFDYSLEEHRHGVDLSPIATRTQSVLKLFDRDMAIEDLRPHLPFDPSDEALASGTLSALTIEGPKVLVNAYGAGKEKRLTPASIRRIVDAIRHTGHDGPIYVSVPRGSQGPYEAALLGARAGAATKVLGPQGGGLAALCALVSAVDVVISPDTAVGHIAAAFRKPQVSLFARRGSVPVIWKPLNRAVHRPGASRRRDPSTTSIGAEVERAIEAAGPPRHSPRRPRTRALDPSARPRGREHPSLRRGRLLRSDGLATPPRREPPPHARKRAAHVLRVLPRRGSPLPPDSLSRCEARFGWALFRSSASILRTSNAKSLTAAVASRIRP